MNRKKGFSFWRIVAALLVLHIELTSVAALAVEATVSQILVSPTAFDGQHVTVSGTAQFARPRTSRKGNDYETFSLCEQACVNVFTWGHPHVAEDKRLTVSGTFQAVKHVGRYTVHNEIDADESSL
jgi:hypothetical protein